MTLMETKPIQTPRIDAKDPTAATTATTAVRKAKKLTTWGMALNCQSQPQGATTFSFPSGQSPMGWGPKSKLMTPLNQRSRTHRRTNAPHPTRINASHATNTGPTRHDKRLCRQPFYHASALPKAECHSQACTLVRQTQRAEDVHDFQLSKVSSLNSSPCYLPKTGVTTSQNSPDLPSNSSPGDPFKAMNLIT
jgi:hypothetical protein